MQNHSISIANALWILQSCTRPSQCPYSAPWLIGSKPGDVLITPGGRLSSGTGLALFDREDADVAEK